MLLLEAGDTKMNNIKVLFLPPGPRPGAVAGRSNPHP